MVCCRSSPVSAKRAEAYRYFLLFKMFYKIFWDSFVAHACPFKISVFFGCKRPARFYCLLLATGRAGDLGDSAPRRKDVRPPGRDTPSPLGSGTPRRGDRRGPAGAPRGPGRARRPLPELRPGGRAGGAGARSGPGPRAARSLRACRAAPL